MRALKFFRAIFLILFLAAVVPAAIIAYKDVGQMREIQPLIDEGTAKIVQLRNDLSKTSLEYRGFSESLKSIPDDKKAAEMGRITAKTQEFNKIVRVLEKEKKETARNMRKHQRILSEAQSHLKNRLLFFGGAAVVFLLGFLVCARSISIRA